MTKHYINLDENYNIVEFKETYNDELITHKRYYPNGKLLYEWREGKWEKFKYDKNGFIAETLNQKGHWKKVINKGHRIVEMLTYDGRKTTHIRRFFNAKSIIEYQKSAIDKVGVSCFKYVLAESGLYRTSKKRISFKLWDLIVSPSTQLNDSTPVIE